MESNGNFIKFHRINAYFKHGNEYTFNRRFLQLKKEFPHLTKNETVIEASKKMMLPILYTVLTTICALSLV